MGAILILVAFSGKGASPGFINRCSSSALGAVIAAYGDFWVRLFLVGTMFGASRKGNHIEATVG